MKIDQVPTPAGTPSTAPTRRRARLRETELEAWRAFLHGHAAITRALDAELVASHRVTLSDYEVLLYLAQAPERRLRMSELAERVLLTRSGVTRLVDGLERAGLVRRADCPEDRRVSYTQLTDAGYANLREAGRTHLAGVRALFVEQFSDEELEELASLLTRLPGARAGDACSGE